MREERGADPRPACSGGRTGPAHITQAETGGHRAVLRTAADDIAQIIAFALMIMSTFAESYDVAGKTVHPVTTYAMSGLGTGPDDYAQTCRGARIVTGLAVRGEQVRSGGTAAVDAWLRRTGLLSRR